MAATGGTTALGLRAGRGRFEVLGRVGTRGDGLLQLLDRRRGLGGDFFDIGAAVGSVCAPLSVTAQVDSTAVGQFQGDGTCEPRQNLVACKQAVAFYQYTLNTFRGYSDYLTNNSLDDGDNTAHDTLRTNRSMWLPYALGCCCRYLLGMFRKTF